MAATGERVITGVTYFPASVGPHLWQEFSADEVTADLRAIAGHGFDAVRVLLSWDSFLDSHRQVSPRRLHDLETLLNIARDAAIQVVPVLGPQSIGDCILLPRYAIDAGAPRPGVRTLSNGRLEAGGPRDAYTDQLMLEVAQLWVETLMSAFSNHPAIAAWDLGHDPARTMRPRRIPDLHAWTALIAERVRQAGDPVWMTLGSDDITTARGVRLAGIASAVDRLNLDMSPAGFDWAPPDERGVATAFVCALAARLSGGTQLGAHIRVADDLGAAENADRSGQRMAQTAITSSLDAGVVLVLAHGWRHLGPRTENEPPYDRAPELRACALADAKGAPTGLADPWMDAARRDRAVQPMSPWPAELDEPDYYANVAEALPELYSAWRDGRLMPPAILG